METQDFDLISGKTQQVSNYWISLHCIELIEQSSVECNVFAKRDEHNIRFLWRVSVKATKRWNYITEIHAKLVEMFILLPYYQLPCDSCELNLK